MTSRWELPTHREPTESEEQRDLIRWIRQNHPKHRVFAIPNGGKRGIREAVKLQTEGVSPGVPDLMIPSLRLFIELKRQKSGRLSPEQKDWIAYLESVGYMAVMCRGSAAAQAVVSQRIRDFHQ